MEARTKQDSCAIALGTGIYKVLKLGLGTTHPPSLSLTHHFAFTRDACSHACVEELNKQKHIAREAHKNKESSRGRADTHGLQEGGPGR